MNNVTLFIGLLPEKRSYRVLKIESNENNRRVDRHIYQAALEDLPEFEATLVQQGFSISPLEQAGAKLAIKMTEPKLPINHIKVEVSIDFYWDLVAWRELLLSEAIDTHSINDLTF